MFVFLQFVFQSPNFSHPLPLFYYFCELEGRKEQKERNIKDTFFLFFNFSGFIIYNAVNDRVLAHNISTPHPSLENPSPFTLLPLPVSHNNQDYLYLK